MISASKKNNHSYFLSCKDFTVSNESFDLFLDESLEMLITTPQPALKDLGMYYESDAYISHTDANDSFFDKVYQLIKRLAIRKKTRLINSFVDSDFKQKKVLDIGCGTGDFLTSCQKNNWNVFGVEPNVKANSIADEKLEKLICKDISEIGDSTFDCITMWHVLEHVPDLKSYIGELKKLLKPNGTLIVAVPNFNSFDAKHYGAFWAAYDVPRHLWHFSKKSIRLLFEKERMSVVKMIPMMFDSFYVSLLSEKHKTGKSNVVRAFLNGLYSNLSAIRSKEYSSIIYIIKND